VVKAVCSRHSFEIRSGSRPGLMTGSVNPKKCWLFKECRNMQSLNNADLGVDTSNSFQILVIVHLLKMFILVFFLWFWYSLLKVKKVELIREGSWLILKKKKRKTDGEYYGEWRGITGILSKNLRWISYRE
jgi:hypothetical protein